MIFSTRIEFNLEYLTTSLALCIISETCHLRRNKEMAGNFSKNAHREGAKVLLSRWGGAIKMKSVFENGKLRHYAVCEKTGNTARKAKDLM